MTDGTWQKTTGVALGKPSKTRYSDFEYTVTGPPTLTTVNKGKTVRMSSTLSVRRISPVGKYDRSSQEISKADKFFFTPGNLNIDTHNEVYGNDVSLDCGASPAVVDDATDCLLSFDAPAAEIANSYWVINGIDMAAWPGQQ
ncbi:hypothetical protein ACFXO9_30560 [Nocardia tengchongensis]|uniref:hypothetical protein n=1 Tax=Nocardia tengchongensis TaxID=2055889 RepID=UPI0036A3705A